MNEKDVEVELEAGRGHGEKDVGAQPTEPVDPYIVDWDGPDDPQNPRNWSEKLKWGNIAVIASITFLTYADNPFLSLTATC